MSNQTWELKIADVSQRLANARRDEKTSRQQAEAHIANADSLADYITRLETELRELAQEYAK